MSTIWTYRDEQTSFYRAFLRTVGAVLDDESASSIHLIETTKGFSVRYGLDRDGTPLGYCEWTYEELLALEAHMRSKRIDPSTGHAHRAVSEPANTSYQEMLRGLGHELDLLRAYNIVLDELEGQFLLIYSYQDPGRGLAWSKKMALVGSEEQSRLLAEHRSHRQTVENRRKLWFR